MTTIADSDPVVSDDPAEIYTTIRSTLDTLLVGQETATRRLALVGVAHLLAPPTAPGAVRWLIGASGSGKTTLLQGLANCLGLPFIRLDATRLTAAGWTGLDPDSVICSTLQHVPPGTRAWRRPLLVLDDAQHLRIKSREDGTDYTHQVNRQASLLTYLCGAARVLITGGSTPAHLWHAAGALRIVAGAFDLTPEQAADPAAVQAAGFIPEVANRLAQPAIHLRLLTGTALGDAVRHGPYSGPLAELFQGLGGARILIEPGAINAIVKRMEHLSGATPRTVKHALDAAIEHRILELIESGTLNPDRTPLDLMLTAADVEAA